jgi:hypothetical protein
MKKRLLILADLGHLKAFRLLYNAPGLKPKLELISTFSTPEASGRMRDKVTDSPDLKRGDVAGTNQGITSDGERHNIDLEFRRRALKELGHQITEIVQHEPDLEECVFAASREIHNAVVELLSPQVRNKLVAEWSENLINAPHSELVRRVDDWQKQTVGA